MTGTTGKAGTTEKKLTNESGAVQIVEATFVFPIMFIILFFLIYMGNAHFVKAQVEAVAEEYALRGAAYCADPMLETIRKENGKIPTLTKLQTKPYRYIFGGMNEVESHIASEISTELKSKSTSFFKNMQPKVVTTPGEMVKFNNYVIYSTFSVDIKYNIQFPIRFLGEHTPVILTLHSRAEAPVNDSAEFIRNTDMVLDCFRDTKFGQTISDVFGKVNSFICSFSAK